MSHAEAVAKYDAANTKRIALKLNKTTDADILELLDSLDNKQGFIKSLIREYLEERRNADVYCMADLRRIARPVAERLGIIKVYVFGSYARGDATKGSDLDLLIEAPESWGLNEFYDAYDAFEAAFDKPLDLITTDGLENSQSESFVANVRKEMVCIYDRG